MSQFRTRSNYTLLTVCNIICQLLVNGARPIGSAGRRGGALGRRRRRRRATAGRTETEANQRGAAWNDDRPHGGARRATRTHAAGPYGAGGGKITTVLPYRGLTQPATGRHGITIILPHITTVLHVSQLQTHADSCNNNHCSNNQRGGQATRLHGVEGGDGRRSLPSSDVARIGRESDPRNGMQAGRLRPALDYLTKAILRTRPQGLTLR